MRGVSQEFHAHKSPMGISDMGGTFWTPERIETLRRLFEDGYSSGLIARELGCSRDTVIGKGTRLGLYGGGGLRLKSAHTIATIAKAQRAKEPPKPARAKPVRPSTLAPLPEVRAMPLMPPMEATGAARAIIELRSLDCRWPLGNAHDPEFRFCGEPATRGPYCACHAERAYAPVKPRPLEPYLPQIARSGG